MQGVCLIPKNSPVALKTPSAFFKGNLLAQNLNNVGNFEPLFQHGQIHDSSLAARTSFLPYS